MGGIQHSSGNPIPVVGVPLAMGVGAAAIFADEGGVGAAAVPPFPTHNGQVVAAGRAVAEGAAGYVVCFTVSLPF